MELSLPERVAILEANYGSIHTIVASTADDVRAIREAVIKDKGVRSGGWRVLALAGTIFVSAGTLWKAFGEGLHKFFSS